MSLSSYKKFTSTHWGTYRAVLEAGELKGLRGVETDVDPSPIAENMLDTLSAPNRIPQPMVRRGFLQDRERSDTSRRGVDPFVRVSWERAEDLVADQLERVRRDFGNESIYAGCYGWASAGRFHHAQSQIHRFMNLFGGYTASADTYSFASAEVMLPHIIASMWAMMHGEITTWPSIIENTELMVCFGGIPLKNGQVANGGTGRHVQREYMRAARDKGVQFVGISPLRSDLEAFLDAEWIAPIPGTDSAIMLGLAHTLVCEDLHDKPFLDRYCVGFERFEPYLRGHVDGRAKDADWASEISGVPVETIRQLARRMAQHRSMVSVSWSLSRQDHGEQNYWMATTLAAILGQIGLPGGGIGIGYCAENAMGNHTGHLRWAALPQGVNSTGSFIPVARISDMLLNPGQPFQYNGKEYRYPDARMVYWLGGNPYHHHQDLNRLLEAWRRPEVIIVHEPWWTATAKYADIVLPCTSPLERNDLSANTLDGFATPMHRLADPFGQSRNDYDILAAIARRLGFEQEFTEGRDEEAWLRELYAVSCERGRKAGLELPSFETFWEEGFELPAPPEPSVMLDAFRRDPAEHPISTPSGKIEIFSERIASFGYDDCPGHASWIEPTEGLRTPLAARFPLHLITNQPKTRLHSQLDHGQWSQRHKVAGRESITLHPSVAAARDIRDGDLVRVFNDRGACLAGAVVSDEVAPFVVQMATGAWFDPAEPGTPGSLCKNGNPNVLTLDKGTSKLAQGPSANSTLVEVERYDAQPPTVTAYDPPEIEGSSQCVRVGGQEINTKPTK